MFKLIELNLNIQLRFSVTEIFTTSKVQAIVCLCVSELSEFLISKKL